MKIIQMVTCVLGAGLVLGLASRDAVACGGEWFPIVEVDPRIAGVARAEQALSDGRHTAAAGSVIRMIPHIKTLKGKPGSLVARAERVLAVALARSDAKLAVAREIPREISGTWLGKNEDERRSNIDFSIAVLRRQASQNADDSALRTELAEALALSVEHRGEAREILEELARRDLVSSPEGYRALALLRSAAGDSAGTDLAMRRCEAMSASKATCHA